MREEHFKPELDNYRNEKAKDSDLEADTATADRPSRSDDEAQDAIPEVTNDMGEVLPFSRAKSLLLVVTVTGASILNTLGVQASVIILPTIGKHLDIPNSRQQWIVSSYNLTFGCFLLLWGRIADVWGKKRIFLIGSAWISVVSVALPFMPDEISFDVFRGLQGLGAAAMVPTALGILGTTFPPGKYKNWAFAAYGAGAPLGAVFGNIFGGVLTEYLDWEWVFWIFAILSALITVAAFFLVPPSPRPTEPLSLRHHVDWVGGTLITIGILILLFALTEGNVVGWDTPWVSVLIVVAFLIIAVFILWQRHLEKKNGGTPLMKVSIFKNVSFSAALVIMFLFFASFNNFLITLTYWMQEYQGLSVIQTTIRFITTGVTGVITAALTGKYLLPHVRGDFILVFGNVTVSLASLLCALPFPPFATYWAYIFPAMILSVFGADTLYPTLMIYTSKSLPPEDQALGGALINAVGQVGRAVGLAIMTAIETAVIAEKKGVPIDWIGGDKREQLVGVGDEALKVGLRSASWFSTGIGLAAVVVAAVFFRGVGKVGGRH